MYPLIICEDSISQLNAIKQIINLYTGFYESRFNVSLITSSPHEVLDYLETYQPKKGVFLLDVHLNSTIDGLDLAEAIRKNDVNAKIVFITTDEHAAPLTFKRNLEAMSFIEKPSNVEELRKNIFETLNIAYNRLTTSLDEKKQLFTFSRYGETVNIDFEKVLYLQTSIEESHKLTLTTTLGEYEFSGSLIKCEENFPELFRISKSALINPGNVVSINYKNRDIVLKNNHIIQYAFRRAKSIKEKFSNPNKN